MGFSLCYLWKISPLIIADGWHHVVLGRMRDLSVSVPDHCLSFYFKDQDLLYALK